MPYDADWELVRRKFGGYCVFPNCWQRMTTCHEEPPRSIEKKKIENMYPLCREHHELIQTLPREEAQRLLTRGAELVFKLIG